MHKSILINLDLQINFLKHSFSTRIFNSFIIKMNLKQLNKCYIRVIKHWLFLKLHQIDSTNKKTK